MSNPIKFRVWSKTESKWMSNIVLSAEGTPILLFSEKKGKKVSHHVYLIDNYEPVVQPWTGAQDKNGRDIFVGDILKECGEVRDSTSISSNPLNDEIVGNIFESPVAPPAESAPPVTEESLK